MRLEDALREAFARDIAAVPERRPGAAEVSRAMSGRRIDSVSFLPLAVLAAATLVMAWIGQPALDAVRPLARELSLAMSDEAGSRFVDFVLEAGESYRSAD